MQREQARLRDLGGYSGPCSVRGYVSTLTPNTVNLDRVYKEQGGVRISVARNIAPKVPSIKELILQLNRKQYGEEPNFQPRPNFKPRRKSLNSISSRLPELSDSNRGSQSVISSRDLVIQVGDASPPPGVSSKGRSSPILPIPNHRPKLPWRLSNNSQHNNPKLGGLMNIRHLASEAPENRTENNMEDKIEDKIDFLDREMEKSSWPENICQNEGLDGLLVCSSITHHKVSLSEPTLSKMNLGIPSMLKRPRPHSSSLPPVNPSSTSIQRDHTHSNPHDSFSLASEFQPIQTSRKASMPESIPVYQDPIYRAPTTFHQRIIELSILESDTIRVERQKLMKKKKSHNRQD